MATVEIDGNEYEAYSDLETADLYAAAAFHADTWLDLDDDPKGKTLVTGTRTLDRQIWKGEKTDPDQELEWPRKNTGVDGVVDDEVPDDIVQASIELAIALADGAEFQTNSSTAQGISSMSAGSVSITFARGVHKATRFPLIVQELIKKYLNGSGSGAFLPKSTGVDEESIFPLDLGYTGGGG
jgi:hypothetical protein